MNTATLLPIITISIKAALISTIIAFIPAIILAWSLISKPSLKKKGLELLLSIPLIIPPVTTGYLLLLLLSPLGPLGKIFHDLFSLNIAFTFKAVILVQTIIAFPLILRSFRQALEMADYDLYEAALVSGSSPVKSFFTVILPVALPGIISGAVLGFARCMGEFGATITFAGNLPGITTTLPLAIYTQLEIPGCENKAFILVVISIFISFTAIIISELLNSYMIKKKEFYHGSVH